MGSPDDPGGWGPSEKALALGRRLAIDGATAEVVTALERRGIEAILLKGPSFGALLHDSPRIRPYTDCDLLVEPGRRGEAEAVLRELGFAPVWERLKTERPVSALPWSRDEDNAMVDLHETLTGVAVPAEEAWAILAPESGSMAVGGRAVAILSEAARTLHVALHAAQHGDGAGPRIEDLRLAVERLPERLWKDAAELAGRLGAVDALAAGLRLHEGGRGIASRLGLPEAARAETVLRAGHAPPLALAVESLTRPGGGVGRKIAFVLRKVFPPPAYVRQWWPDADRSAWRLLLAYVRRPFWLLRRAPRAIAAVRTARAQERDARRRGS